MKPEVKDSLIGYGKLHKPVTSSTVTRWIKDELSRAGAVISVYKAHSGRPPSSRKTRGVGISIQDILKRGCWKNACVKILINRDQILIKIF